MDRRRARGRLVMVALGVCNLVLLPFGTALGGYAIWVLLSPGTRRLFERHVWADPKTDDVIRSDELSPGAKPRSG